MDAEQTRPGRAVIFLGGQTLEGLLSLPDGMRVVAVSHDFARLGVLLGVESDALPSLPEGCVPEELGGSWGPEVLVDDDGKCWYRWNWMPSSAESGA